MERKTEGKEKEVNSEVEDKIVAVESGNRLKRKKLKKRKQESDFATEGKESEGNTDVSGKIDNMSQSSGDVTVEAGSHTKKKKKKQKRDLEIGKIEAGGEEQEIITVVEGKIDKNKPASSCDISEELDNHKKRKKTKKEEHVSDLVIEKMKENSEDKDIINDDMPWTSCDVTEKSDSHKNKKKKKSKKEKHITDFAAEKTKEKIEGKKKELNSEVEDKIDNDVPSSSCVVTEESSIYEKRKKKKMRKHESDFVDIGPSSCGVPDESVIRKKIKKAKKLKHEEESKERELNADVKDKLGNNTPSGHITEESSIQETSEKAKKRRRESDLVIDDTDEKAELKEKDTIMFVKDKTGPSSVVVTEECSSHKKKKKEHKNKLKQATVKMEENEGIENIDTDDKQKIANDLPLNRGFDVIEESDIVEKKKKRKKQKEKRKEKKDGSVTEEMGERTESTDKEIGSDVKDKVENDIFPNSCDVTEDSGCNEMEKTKNEKHETDLEEEITKGKENNGKADVRNAVRNDMPSSVCDVIDKSGSQKKKKKKKSREGKHESTKSLEQKSGCKEKEAKADVKDGLKKDTSTTNNLILAGNNTENTVTIDVSKELEKEEIAGTSEDMSESCELDEKKKIDGKNQWESAEFTSMEKKDKFLRLMGAFKPSSKQRGTSNYSAMAMSKEQEKAFASSLEKQYFQAMQSGKGKGKRVGLGYE